MQKKNPAAVALAKARAKSLTPERRSEIAQKAAAAKWAKLKTKKERLNAVSAANSARRKSNEDNG